MEAEAAAKAPEKDFMGKKHVARSSVWHVLLSDV